MTSHEKREGGMGQAAADELFDTVFERTTNIEFLCGDFKQFKKNVLDSDVSNRDERDRPAMLIATRREDYFDVQARQMIEHVA